MVCNASCYVGLTCKQLAQGTQGTHLDEEGTIQNQHRDSRPILALKRTCHMEHVWNISTKKWDEHRWTTDTLQTWSNMIHEQRLSVDSGKAPAISETEGLHGPCQTQVAPHTCKSGRSNHEKEPGNKICAEAVEQHALVTSQVCSAQLSSPALPALASPNHLMHLTKDGHQDHQSNGSHNYMPHSVQKNTDWETEKEKKKKKS